MTSQVKTIEKDIRDSIDFLYGEPTIFENAIMEA